MDETELPAEETYVVNRMRETGDVLRFNRDSRPFLSVDGESVCTFDTLFRMLGRGVVKLDPTATQKDRYVLTDEWKLKKAAPAGISLMSVPPYRRVNVDVT